ncbi:MAG: MerR family transcriptional regulator [Aquabacterium sp.]|uniref:MerR family transcriptional regulator n=1 Tax=Aquabacterium sp. TaxID=1872578 RepID=UPI0025C1133A|nr:MerR family transcriptional regulator [Aquabacterium sp.]MBI5924556.1 MerR family transcriptional regulator [Aquabacterium sp.]
MQSHTCTIGQVAWLTAVTAKAIRHYESLGLLPFVARAGRYRHYDQAHVLAIRLIRQAQDLGFTLAETQTLLMDDGCTPDWSAMLQAIEAKRQSIQADIERLQQRDLGLNALSQTLSELMAQSNDCDVIATQLANADAFHTQLATST